MITKREWYLLSVNFLLIFMMMGGTFNFIAVTKNEGRMPILTDNPLYLDYQNEHYFSVDSCEGINYCFAVDRFGGEFLNYYIKFSVGDVILILSYFVCVSLLINWALLVKKDYNNLLPKIEKYQENKK